MADTQRLLISDDGTTWVVGASFLAADVASELDFTATPIDGSALTDLLLLLHEGESVRGGWTFTAGGEGYSEGDPAYLSFDIGGGFARGDLNLWHHDGSHWTEYAAGATYDGQYASFTVTGFSGYAVSAVPEPGTMVMLLSLGVAGLFAYVWRRRRAA